MVTVAHGVFIEVSTLVSVNDNVHHLSANIALVFFFFHIDIVSSSVQVVGMQIAVERKNFNNNETV